MDFSATSSLILNGLLTTVIIFAGASAFGIVGSFIVGLMRLSRFRMLRWSAIAYIEFFRGTSALVQLFWIFFAMPQLTGISLPVIGAGIIALGLNLAGYGAEVVRSTIQSVDKGQREAAQAVSLRPAQIMYLITIPQAIPTMIPPFANLLIETMKNTALAFLISAPELLFAIKAIISQHPDQRLVFYLLGFGIYLLLALSFILPIRWWESSKRRNLGQGAGHA